MTVDRRAILAAGFAVGAGAAGAKAAGPRRRETDPSSPISARASALGIEPGSTGDQTAIIQAAIDKISALGGRIVLPPGRFLVRTLTLRPGISIAGSGRASILAAVAGHRAALIRGEGADGVALTDFVVEGDRQARAEPSSGLVELTACRQLALQRLEVRAGPANGIVLRRCGGRVTGCDLHHFGEAGLFSTDAEGIEIADNTVMDCDNNGILVWRSSQGADGTTVTQNRIERIAARRGGSGQYGNGINVFRAGGVLVTANRITGCAYTAIRGNAASNIQMVANNCSGLGEVALYAEFGFEGALIASNVVDGAAAGISVTNFNEGGRLAVVTGNLIRNLVRREHEPVDKRGEGIAVEADAVVNANVIEEAPTAGIVIGWGPHMRDVSATGNVIRKAGVGILIAADPGAGACMVAQNLISGARDGAIRAMDRGRAFGPDLARSGTTSTRVTIAGNVAV